MTDAGTVVLGWLQVIMGLFLLLFLPGFAFTLVYFPKRDELDFFDRLVISAIWSIGLVILIGISMDLILGIDTTPRNIAIVVLVVSALILILWRLVLKFRNHGSRLGAALTKIQNEGKGRLHFLIKRKDRMVSLIRKSHGRKVL